MQAQCCQSLIWFFIGFPMGVSRDKNIFMSRCTFVPGQNHHLIAKKMSKKVKNCDFFFFFFKLFFLFFFLLSCVLTRDGTTCQNPIPSRGNIVSFSRCPAGQEDLAPLEMLDFFMHNVALERLAECTNE